MHKSLLYLVNSLFLLTPFTMNGQLIINGVIDGPLSGGTPKAIELLATADIPDLSIYAIGSANNGGGSDGEEFALSGSASSGDILFIASESPQFQSWFGFTPDFTSAAASINGDDAIELFQNGSVIDVFGEINVDGTGQPWEYMDGWAKRVPMSGPDGSTFVLGNWTFSGPNALDGETSNASASTPYPLEPSDQGSPILITGVVDGPLTGGTPKAIELLVVQDIADLSAYGIGSANNGGGSDGEEFTLSGSAVAGDYLYIASETSGFEDFFGISPDFTSSAASINGDDAIELFENGIVIDVFGEINVDGTGQPWEYLDSWAKRVDATGPDGSTFVLDNWIFGGVDALDGETTNASASTPFPIGETPDEGSDLVITGVVDGPLSGGVPKAIELFAVNDVADLSVYGFGSANNGGGSDGEEFTLSGSVDAGQYLYIATETTGFNTFFGFDPDFTSGAAAINGDDAIELFRDGNVVDVFGEISVDGSGQPWEYTDGWAKRLANTGPDGDVFQLANWEFSGPNALDGESDNATAAVPFPLGRQMPKLIITGVIDGPLSGGVPKAIELYACEQIDDLSAYGLGSANNGGGSDGEEFSLTGTAMAGQFIYIASEQPGFNAFFGFDPDFTTSAASVNGDDAIELFFGGEVIDVFGDINMDGSGQPWEYLDGWAYRVNGSGPDGSTFIADNWSYSSPNALDGETTNSTAAVPFPISTYSKIPDPVIIKIHEVQGSGSAVSSPGAVTVIEAVVTGDYQEANGIGGFFVQEESSDEDGDPSTSEGIFVFCGSCNTNVQEGQIVRVQGIQEEFFDNSQLDITSGGLITIIDAGDNLDLVTPAILNLPAVGPTDEAQTFEAFEGMLVTIPQELTATEFFQLGRFGSVVMSAGGRQLQYTSFNGPDVAGFQAYQEEVQSSRIILDDNSNGQNTALFNNIPVYHPQPGGFSVNNFFRGGSTINQLTGPLQWSFGAWRIRPQISNPPTFSESNPREQTPPNIAGDIRVASFNVLNYFNGDGQGGGFPTERGANSQAELDRQTDKIVAAIQSLDADIIALVELENDYIDGPLSAIASLTDELNAAGPIVYNWVDPGQNVGDDAIAVGFIYREEVVRVKNGTTIEILDDSDLGSLGLSDLAPVFNGVSTNRAALAATFKVKDNTKTSKNEVFTLVVNHFKSKGSNNCTGANCDQGDGQGAYNLRRKAAAQALVAWLDSKPTGTNDDDYLILGDLNAYAMEDPIQYLVDAGYSDVVNALTPSENYSFVFDGQWGALDYALANSSLLSQTVGAVEWHINADEVNLLDYNDEIQDPGEQSFEAKPSANPLFAPDQFRSSDHDPVIVGLDLDKNRNRSVHTVGIGHNGPTSTNHFAPLTVSPNPTSGKIFLSIENDTPTAMKRPYTVFDLLGRVVHEGFFPAYESSLTIDLTMLPTGTYNLRVQTSGDRNDNVLLIKN